MSKRFSFSASQQLLAPWGRSNFGDSNLMSLGSSVFVSTPFLSLCAPSFSFRFCSFLCRFHLDSFAFVSIPAFSFRFLPFRFCSCIFIIFICALSFPFLLLPFRFYFFLQISTSSFSFRFFPFRLSSCLIISTPCFSFLLLPVVSNPFFLFESGW